MFETEPKLFSGVEGLTTGEEERVLALDPDFCNWSFTGADLASIPNLKALVLQTTGFDWVDVAACTAKNIPVIQLKGFSSEAVAEWALFMALALARKLPVLAQDGWKQDFVKHEGVELKGKTAGIIGLGTIGLRIAELAAGAGMEVVYWSRESRSNTYKYVELAELLQTADVIFPAMAKNADTLSLLSPEAFGDVKENAIVVSVMHDLVAHEYLLKRVEAGTLFGYGFEENASFDKYRGNIFASPEIAWATNGSMKRNGEMWTKAIIDAANGTYSSRVN
jgi:lactate dehydrogenase-like 2-hydroxyacid dehydrogenase